MHVSAATMERALWLKENMYHLWISKIQILSPLSESLTSEFHLFFFTEINDFILFWDF